MSISNGGTSISDRYATLLQLGENDLAITYLAKAASGGENVVVKVPVDRIGHNSSFAYQLERAALEMIRVKHPHIVKVIDAGRADGVPYVATTYVNGESLAQQLQNSEKGQTPTQVYNWLIDIAEALDFIHAKEVVHGEVRPSHILFLTEDHPLLTDFAFSAALKALDKPTRRQLLPDQPGFTAPEAASGELLTPASDQWALAATAYMAITGETASYDLEAMQEKLRRRVSPEATADLMRALAPDPTARFPSCFEFARAFGLERKRLRTESAAPEIAFGGLPILGSPPPIERGESSALNLDLGPDASKAKVAEERPPDSRGRGEAIPDGRWWRVRLGTRDQFARAGRDGGFIAVGWEELGDLEASSATDDLSALPELIRQFGRTYGVSGMQARVGAAQVWRFLSVVEKGDLVVVPNPAEALMHVGLIEGDATSKTNPSDGCSLPRRRAVRWLDDLPFAEIPISLLNAITDGASIVDLTGHRRLLRQLLSPIPEERPDTERETSLLDTMVSSLYAMDIDRFQIFLRGLFTAIRYDAELLPGASDETWEAAGTLSARAVAHAMLRTWIHRSRKELDVGIVWETRGSLAADEHGAVFSLGTFTDRARFEAGAEGKKGIQLLDGRALAALVLEHWMDLPAEAREGLGVRRTEQATIVVRYDKE